MLRTLWGDDERYKEVYWSKFEAQGYYFAGDGAKRDEDGFYWLLGRVDDVINVAGHRVSTMEVESALVDHKSVAEAAAIGKAHEIKGQAISAFVTLKEGFEMSQELQDELKKACGDENRRDLPPRRYLLHRRAAQDPLRQDHAASPARYRRWPRFGRYDHPSRPERGRVA